MKSRIWLYIGVASLVAFSASLAQKPPDVQFEKYKGGVMALAASDRLILAAPKKKSTIRVFDASKGKPIGTFKQHKAEIASLTIAGNDSLAASTEETGLAVELWRPQTTEEVTILNRSKKTTALMLSDDGRLLAVGTEDGELSLLEVPSGREIQTLSLTAESVKGILENPRMQIRRIALSPSGIFVAVIHQGGLLAVWDRQEPNNAELHLNSPYRFVACRFSPDGRYLAAVGHKFRVNIGGGKAWLSDYGGTVLLLDTQNKETKEISTEKAILEEVYWTPDSKSIIICSSIPSMSGSTAKVIAIHSLQSVLEGRIESPSGEMAVGNAAIGNHYAFVREKSTLVIELQDTLAGWIIP